MIGRRDTKLRWAGSLACTVVAAAFAACGGGSTTTSGTDSAPTAASSAAPSEPLTHPPERTDGSAVVLSKDEKQVYVADEDHEVVFVTPAAFTDLSGVRVVPMPGPPAQIVVADDLVLVTIRTLP